MSVKEPVLSEGQQPECKKRKVDDNQDVNSNGQVWLSLSGCLLSEEDKSIILSGKWLTDKHMDFSQNLLKKQFPGLNGLQSTLWLSKHPSIVSSTNFLPIVHARNNHWIVLSTLGCQANQVNVYDSLYVDVDRDTEKLIKKLFGTDISINVSNSPRQQGQNECGLFAIANCVSLVNWCHYDSLNFAQEKMWSHLIKCLENYCFSQFPKQ